MPPAAELYAENLALKERVGSLAGQIGELEERVAVLQQQIAWFKRKLFGGGQGEKTRWSMPLSCSSRSPNWRS